MTRVEVPVVSVGNLTMGGSGKTPVVQYLARFFLEQGWRPAVVSRGYGGSSKAKVNIVSDGNDVLLDAGKAGDEPRLLAETLAGVPVLTGRKRRYPAAKAVELGVDILILDDGFQHMALGRDVDIVLFNADFLAGNSTVFPGGDLREPVKALNRCHGFVITGVNPTNRDRAQRFRDLLGRHFPDHPVFLAGYRPSAVLVISGDDAVATRSLDVLDGVKFFGFSGIAHPGCFQKTLHELGVALKGFRSFPDHFSYRKEDLQALFDLAEKHGADACITTEKDMVKLMGMKKDRFPLYVVRMEVEFDNSFEEFLLDLLASQ